MTVGGDPHAILFEGKEYPLWTEAQLEKINRLALKNRALGMRDSLGKDRLPPMPRHPEAMVTWILDVQSMMQQAGNGRRQQQEESSEYGDEAPPSYAPHNGSRGPPAYASRDDTPPRGQYSDRHGRMQEEDYGEEAHPSSGARNAARAPYNEDQGYPSRGDYAPQGYDPEDEYAPPQSSNRRPNTGQSGGGYGGGPPQVAAGGGRRVRETGSFAPGQRPGSSGSYAGSDAGGSQGYPPAQNRLVRAPSVTSEAPSEAQSAYMHAKMNAQAIRLRNQGGSGMAGIFGR